MYNFISSHSTVGCVFIQLLTWERREEFVMPLRSLQIWHLAPADHLQSHQCLHQWRLEDCMANLIYILEDHKKFFLEEYIPEKWRDEVERLNKFEYYVIRLCK